MWVILAGKDEAWIVVVQRIPRTAKDGDWNDDLPL